MAGRLPLQLQSICKCLFVRPYKVREILYNLSANVPSTVPRGCSAGAFHQRSGGVCVVHSSTRVEAVALCTWRPAIPTIWTRGMQCPAFKVKGHTFMKNCPSSVSMVLQ